jgi:hypothetical protein
MENPEPATERSTAKSFLFIELGIFPPTTDFVRVIRANTNIKNDIVFWNVFEKYCYVTNKEKIFISAKNELNPEYKSPDKHLNSFLEANKIKTAATPPDTTFEMWEDMTGTIAEMFPIYRENKELLEYYALLVLFYKRLDLLPDVTERYKAQGYEILPEYVQEAIHIYRNGAISEDKLRNTSSYTYFYYYVQI